MKVAPFPTNAILLAIAMAYTNVSFIADLILPRIRVGKQEYKYYSFAKGQYLTIPETRVGRKSRPNQVELNATEVDGVCQAYGLDDVVPQDDVDNAPPGMDPMGQATEFISSLVALDREQRVANLVFNAATYAATNKTLLAGNHQWNVTHADSDPIEDILAGIDACFQRPNAMAIGRAAFTKLQTNAVIVKAINRSTGDKGIATRRAIADLFELDDIYVGETYYSTAKKGQAPNATRLWGKHCLLFYKNPRLIRPDAGMTFGFTAWWKQFAGNITDPHVGIEGGQIVRAGEYVDEHIMAADCAYFIENCVA